MIESKKYNFWISDDVRPYILEFVKKKFPNKFVLEEFDQVDIFVLEEGLPIEIQSVGHQTKGKIRLEGPRVATFEDNIRRQIDANLSTYGKCWLFFDALLLEYLQNANTRHYSINLDWLYQYMKSGKMNIFTITSDGIIRELSDDDFSFLPDMSLTCGRSEEEDFRILRKNRPNIILNILKGHKFTVEETDHIYSLFKSNEEYSSFCAWSTRKENGRTDRELEYGYIRDLRIEHINNVLDCMIGYTHKSDGQPRSSRSLLYMLLVSGLFERKNDRIYFVDVCNVAQYFPAYIRKKELWDFLREHGVNEKTFNAIIRGETDYLWWIKGQTTIDDAWS